MSPAKRHMDRVARAGCVICALRLGRFGTPASVHHVAEGSGLRSPFAVAGLCYDHHQGGAGIHGLGTRRFAMLYRIPGETEYGLLVLQNELLARVDARSELAPDPL